jgi:hypothetical protein
MHRYRSDQSECETNREDGLFVVHSPVPEWQFACQTSRIAF